MYGAWVSQGKGAGKARNLKGIGEAHNLFVRGRLVTWESEVRGRLATWTPSGLAGPPVCAAHRVWCMGLGCPRAKVRERLVT